MPPSRSQLVLEPHHSIGLLVACQSSEAPSDVEWDELIAAAIQMRRSRGQFRLLVHTDGGHPNRFQVERLKRSGAVDCHPSTAVISPHGIVRFVISAMTFMNPRIKSFTPDELSAAYQHLELAAADTPAVEHTVERLKRSLGAA